MSVTDEIKAQIDIVELINSYTPLKKAGRNYKALCPFHHEKTPSFVVFPDSGTWRCFGACGEGGDIFAFIMKREGLDFREAMRMLAERAGIELTPQAPQQEQARETVERLRSLLADAAHFFHQQLLKSPNADDVRAYVERRGLKLETVTQFEIGYAPDSWDATLHYLTNLGYTQEEASEAGMLVTRDEGGVYDRFRNRLVIPIRDVRGRAVGFGARALAKDAQPKYLNSPQSELFDKSRLLYGLDLARRTIRETETAVIVEGYMDVIQAHQAGYTNVVAQMGTSLTEAQLKLLARYANRLILALDSDAAGQMATQRGREVIERVSKAAAEHAVEERVWGFDAAERDYHAKLTTEFDARGMIRYESRLGFDIRVLLLPEGKDPDDLIRQRPELWPELIDKAMPIVEYVIRSATAGQDLENPKVKAAIAKQIVPLIEDVADPVERSHYRQRLARLLKVEERALFPEGKAPPISTTRKSKGSSGGRSASVAVIAQTEGEPRLTSPTEKREAFCLAALIQHPRLLYYTNRVFAEALDPAALIQPSPNLTQAESLPDVEVLAQQVMPGDFAHPEHRLIFQTWRDALNQDGLEPVQYLQQTLEEFVWERIQRWLEQPLYAMLRAVIPPDSNNLTYAKIRDEAVQGLLGLRQKRLEEHLQELHYLIGDMDHGGSALTVLAYGDTIRSLTAARKRIEQARELSTPASRARPANGATIPRTQGYDQHR